VLFVCGRRAESLVVVLFRLHNTSSSLILSITALTICNYCCTVCLTYLLCRSGGDGHGDNPDVQFTMWSVDFLCGSLPFTSCVCASWLLSHMSSFEGRRKKFSLTRQNLRNAQEQT